MWFLGPVPDEHRLSRGWRARGVRRRVYHPVDEPMVIDPELLDELYAASSNVRVGVLNKLAEVHGEEYASVYAEALIEKIRERGLRG